MHVTGVAQRAASLIPEWFAPPVLPTRERTRRAYALWVISWPFFAVVAVVLAIAVAVEPETLARRAVTVTVVGALVVALHTLNRRGRTELASWMLVIGLSVIVTQRAWVTGGIHAPVAVFYTLFILMAGALLGARAGIVTSAICALCAVFLTLAETSGWRAPPAGEGPALAAFVFVALAIGLALVVLHVVASVTTRAHARDNDQVKMIVHDLRSPITALQIQLQMLRADAPAIADQVDEALDGTKTLERMTNNLLDISRLEAGGMPVQRSFTNVGNVARGVVRSLARTAPDRDIQVVGQSAVGWPCDAELLRRIIDNLVTNAIKHTPAGGAIQIHIAEDGDHVRVAVQDEGPGISEEVRDRLFTTFTTAGSANAHSPGLGLAFCKLAAEAHGGTIRVGAAKPRGSVFVVELPAQ